MIARGFFLYLPASGNAGSRFLNMEVKNGSANFQLHCGLKWLATLSLRSLAGVAIDALRETFTKIDGSWEINTHVHMTASITTSSVTSSILNEPILWLDSGTYSTNYWLASFMYQCHWSWSNVLSVVLFIKPIKIYAFMVYILTEVGWVRHKQLAWQEI